MNAAEKTNAQLLQEPAVLSQRVAELQVAAAQREGEDYRRNLEHEVEARNRELQAKNAQLEDAPRQLQDLQTQVIRQQHRASLGTLTAEIAHERAMVGRRGNNVL